MENKELKEQKPEDQSGGSGFINELAEKGVKNVNEFRDQLLEVLRKKHEEKVQVRKLFPNFKKDSKEHDFLKSLSTNKLVQPVGGGSWKADSIMRFTKDGRTIARGHKLPVTPLVFVSYAHEDEEWKKLLMKHLGVLGNSAHLEIWEDDKIGTGQDFKSEIVDALKLADAAVLLISADFLTSEFIQREEVPRILEDKGNAVFPILVRPCAWKKVKWLSEIKVHIAEGEKALSQFTEGKALSKDMPPPAVEICFTQFTEEIADRMEKVSGISSD